MRKHTSAEERAAKIPENDRPPYWFYGESIRTSVHGSHIDCESAIIEMPSWELT